MAGVDYRISTIPGVETSVVAILLGLDEMGRLSVVREVVPCGEPVALVDVVTANGKFSIPTPTPTPTATATTPTNTPTATPTPSSSPPPTPTNDPSETVVFLPMTWRMSCLKRPTGVDVGLVIDASTSMERSTSTGRSKIESAQAAALSLTSSLNLDTSSASSDRIAIVGFNDVAWIESPLSDDFPTAERAIWRLSERTAEGTRLDLAVREGVIALTEPTRSDLRHVVLIVLTDGLPNRVPTPPSGGGQEDTVLAEADEAKGRGWTVYTVGLGSADAPDPLERINSDLLRRMASSSAAYFETPDAEDLRKIFSEISESVACR